MKIACERWDYLHKAYPLESAYALELDAKNLLELLELPC